MMNMSMLIMNMIMLMRYQNPPVLILITKLCELEILHVKVNDDVIEESSNL